MKFPTVLLFILVLTMAACAPATEGEAPATPTAEGEAPAATPTVTEEPAAPQAAPTAAATATEEVPATAPADNLAGTQWTLVSLGAPGEETPVVEGTTVTLQFEGGGQATGSGGCNSFGTDYEVEGNTLSLGEIVSTMVACLNEGVMAQEERYYEALRTAGQFERAGDRLTIWYDGGQGVLNFVAATGEATATAEAGTPEAARPLQVRRLQMVDASRGWALGRVDGAAVDGVFFTADGGETWPERTPAGAPAAADSPLQEITAAAFFVSAERGWVAYTQPSPQTAQVGPQVWSTADGGQSWQASAALDLSGLPFEFFLPSDVGFTSDGQMGWLLAHLGAGMSHDYIAIFTTADGGQTWQRVTDPEANPEIQGCQKSGLVFTSAADGWLAGNCPGLMPALFLYRTADGGATWTQTTLPAAEGMAAEGAGSLGDRCGVEQMSVVAPATVMLSLHCFDFTRDTSQGWLYSSADGGQSWQSYPLPAPAASFAFVDLQEGWLLGSDATQTPAVQEVWHTADGGQTWSNLAQVPGERAIDLDFADGLNGWILSGQGEERTLWRSGDGGGTWEELAPVATVAQ